MDITDEGDEWAVVGAFAVGVSLDEVVGEAVHVLGSPLALGHVVIVLAHHRTALVQRDNQRAERGAAPLLFVRVHIIIMIW